MAELQQAEHQVAELPLAKIKSLTREIRDIDAEVKVLLDRRNEAADELGPMIVEHGQEKGKSFSVTVDGKPVRRTKSTRLYIKDEDKAVDWLKKRGLGALIVEKVNVKAWKAATLAKASHKFESWSEGWTLYV